MTTTTTTVLATGHTVVTWAEPHAMVPYAAHCRCAWQYASVSTDLRTWNIEGHAQYVTGTRPNLHGAKASS